MSLTAQPRLSLIRQDLETLVARQIITDIEKDVHNWREVHPLLPRGTSFYSPTFVHTCESFNFGQVGIHDCVNPPIYPFTTTTSVKHFAFSAW